MTAADALEKIFSPLADEVGRLKGEKQALEAKINALRLTEQELAERIGDQMKNLEVKKQLEALQKRAREWGSS
jgi:hypothetical protein